MFTLTHSAGTVRSVAVDLPPVVARAPSLTLDGPTVGLLLLVVALGAAVFVLWTRNRRRARDAAMLASYVRAVRRDPAPGAIPAGMSAEIRAIAGDVEAVRAGHLARLEEAAREREWIVSVLSHMPDGVAVTEARGIVVLVNRALLLRAGVSEARALGRLFIEVIQDHEVNEVVRRCLSSGVEERSVVQTEPGRTYLNVIATPLGHHGGCVVVLQDVTEVRRLEKVRRDFVANVSHELRTPLASLKLLAETIASGGADEPEVLKDYVQRIDIEVDRLAQMVDELGELTLIETGQVSLDKRPVNVEALVARSVERLEAQAVRGDIGLLLDVPSGLPQPVADERRLEQVLVNLLHNAIKFTPTGGRVSVAASSDGGVVTIRVSDTGVGISCEDLPRIFERFYKADKSRSSRGTGLGLAIARHLIEAHGGRIWADSREGAGSTFSFSLPLRGTSG